MKPETDRRASLNGMIYADFNGLLFSCRFLFSCQRSEEEYPDFWIARAIQFS